MAVQQNIPEYQRLGFASQAEYDAWLAEDREPLRITIEHDSTDKLAQKPDAETQELTATTAQEGEQLGVNAESEQTIEMTGDLSKDRPDILEALVVTEKAPKNLSEVRPDILEALNAPSKKDTIPTKEYATASYPSPSDFFGDTAGKRVLIRGLEAFNAPMRYVANLALDSSINQILPRIGIEPFNWKSQTEGMLPPQTRAEEVMSIGAEILGANLGYLVPFTTGAKLTVMASNVSPMVTSVSTAWLRNAPKDPTKLQAAKEAAIDIAQVIRSTPELMARSTISAPVASVAVDTIASTGAAIGGTLMEVILPGNQTASAIGQLGGAMGPLPALARMAPENLTRFQNVVKAYKSDGRLQLKLANTLQTVVRDRVTRELQESGTILAGSTVGEKPTIQQKREIDDIVNREIGSILGSLSARNPDAPLTSGLTSQSQDVLAFEMAVIKQNPAVGEQRANMVKNAFKMLDSYIMNELASGDPTRMRDAYDMARAYYLETFQEAIANAQREAAEAIAKVTNIDPYEASRVAYDIISRRLALARQTEKALWNKVPNFDPYYIYLPDNELPYENSVAMFDEIVERMPLSDREPFAQDFNMMRRINADKDASIRAEEERIRLTREQDLSFEARISAEAEAFMRAKQIEEEAATAEKRPVYSTSQMIALRGRLLEEGRNAMSGANPSQQRAAYFYQLADAVLADLSRMPIGQGPEFARATAFSRSLHNAWTDTFASKVTPAQIDENGVIVPPPLAAMRVSPERLLMEAFGTGGQRALERFEQLQGAAIIPRIGQAGEITLDSSVFGPVVRTAQEDYVRYHVSKMVNSEGKISRQRFNAFMSDPANIQILEGGNDASLLLRDLRNIETTQEALLSVTTTNNNNIRALERSALSVILGKSNPDTAVATLLNQAKAGDNIRELANEVRKSGDAAIGGLRHALVDYVYSKASNSAGVSFTQMRDVMLSPVSAGEPSIYDMLIKNRLMTQKELDNFMLIINRGVAIEDALTSPLALESLVDDMDPLSDLVIRLMGSRLGTEAGALMGGGTRNAGLLEASAGIRLTQSVLRKTPLLKLRELQKRAVLDPEFMENTLLMVYTPQNRRELQLQINAFMVNAGIDSQEESQMRDTDFGLWEAQE